MVEQTDSERMRERSLQAPPRNTPRLREQRGSLPDRLRAGEFAPGRLRGWLLRLSQTRLDWSGAFARAVERERETGSLFNFAPVLFGLGILTYFFIPAEPLALMVLATAALTAGLALRLKVRGATWLALTAATLFLLGTGVAQWRTWQTEAPVIQGQMTAEISGLVIRRDANSRGSPRYLIRPSAISGLAAADMPALIRLSASSGKTVFAPGETISGKARLMAFNGPAYPGGYDFGFFARFDRLGGTGFFLGAPRGAAEPVKPRLQERAIIALQSFRLTLARRIRASLDGEAGDVAVALITGDRSGIDETTSESLRRSGIAHVLAISGLHMALVALTVVWGVRWLAAWSPALVLHHPIAKWAAGVGLGAATIYLLISGASVATQRAWVMIAVMLTAALADRRAVTIRNVVIAALIILALSPESLMQPGFQMSFAAAAALVAAYQAVRERNWGAGPAAGNGHGAGWLDLLRHAARTAFVYLGGIVFTSLVAGLATGLFAAWHFHRVAPFGLLTNALAMPLVTTLVMPFALIGMLAMPYGMEWPFLRVMGWGIERMIAISDWVNGFGPAGVTGAQPTALLLAGAGGLVMLTLLRTRLRLIGLLPLATIPLLAGTGPPPDIVASQDGRTVAVADPDGRLVLLYPRRNRFVSDIWLRAWSGGSEGNRETVIGDRCDRDLCIARLRDGRFLHLVYDPDLLPQACQHADVLLMPRLRWLHCEKWGREPALVLKRGDFDVGGAHTIRIAPVSSDEANAGSSDPEKKSGFVVTAAQPPGRRPWNRPPGKEEAE